MRDIDQITQTIQRVFPAVVVEQIRVRFPGRDDEGIWYFEQPKSSFQIQIESSTGMCPFLVETHENNERITTHSIEETLQALYRLLHLQTK